MIREDEECAVAHHSTNRSMDPASRSLAIPHLLPKIVRRYFRFIMLHDVAFQYKTKIAISVWTTAARCPIEALERS